MVWYCSCCGTKSRVLTYAVFEAIEEMKREGSLSITSEIKVGSLTLPLKRDEVREKGYGPRAGYLHNSDLDGIFNHISSVITLEIDSANSSKGILRVVDKYELSKPFLESRERFDREELIFAPKGMFVSKFTENGVSCPVCGNIIEKRMLWTDRADASLEKEEKKQCNNAAEAYVQDIKKQIILPARRVDASEADIPQYLEHLIHVESGILYFTERLKELLLIQKGTGRAALREKCTSRKLAMEALDKRISELKNDQERLPLQYNTLKLEINPEEFGLVKPVYPELKKPGLFNKRKVEEENSRLLHEYEKQCKSFETEWAQIESSEIERRKEANRKILSDREQEEKQIVILLDQLESQKGMLLEYDANSLIQQRNMFCLSEIQEAKDKLDALCNARAQLHSLGLVHPKYLDFVALTAISEYFETGRVIGLTGPDGAYNLYESELRANRIIAKLDMVIESLDAIKENQYKAYIVLSEISNSVASLSEKMTTAIDTLTRIEENTEQTAYYAEKNAYYAKVTAELTDALGYMVAFK